MNPSSDNDNELEKVVIDNYRQMAHETPSEMTNRIILARAQVACEQTRKPRTHWLAWPLSIAAALAVTLAIFYQVAVDTNPPVGLSQQGGEEFPVYDEPVPPQIYGRETVEPTYRGGLADRSGLSDEILAAMRSSMERNDVATFRQLYEDQANAGPFPDDIQQFAATHHIVD